MKTLSRPFNEEVKVSRKEKFLKGENEAKVFLLSNADFIYRLIDHVGSLDETENRVPQSVVYFFQLLIRATHEEDEHKDLVTKLSLLENSIVNPSISLPRYGLFSDDLLHLRTQVLPSILDENRELRSALKTGDVIHIFGLHYDDFAKRALRLVESNNFLIFAKDSLPAISYETSLIKGKEYSFVENLYEERRKEIIPNDIYGEVHNYDPDLTFLANLKTQYQSGKFIGPAG
jgi:hypothetical protein